MEPQIAKELHYLVTILGVWFIFWVAFTATKVKEISILRKGVEKFMATADQAITDLTQVFTDLVASNKRIAADFDALLTKIQEANGVDPVKVEALTQTGRDLVNTMNDEASKVEAVLNPPAPEQPAPPADSTPPATENPPATPAGT